MAPSKDGFNQNPEEKSRLLTIDYNRLDGQDNLDTRDISNEGDEAHDDELENDELTEADFAIDEDEEEDE